MLNAHAILQTPPCYLLTRLVSPKKVVSVLPNSTPKVIQIIQHFLLPMGSLKELNRMLNDVGKALSPLTPPC